MASDNKGARVYDIEFDTIMHKDYQISSLHSWSIIARNNRIRNTKLELTFKSCFTEYVSLRMSI